MAGITINYAAFVRVVLYGTVFKLEIEKLDILYSTVNVRK